MNILIVGDSISSFGECGLAHDINFHYVKKLELKNHNITNLSVGGQSNQKIVHKTCRALLNCKEQFDLIIIQWSSLFRINFNKGDSIYDQSCNFTLHKKSNEIIYAPLWEVWAKNFIHPRIEILEWFFQIILLDNFLTTYSIPYVFVKGIDNFVDDISKKNWKQTSDFFKSSVLHIDSHPDEEINDVYNEFVLLYDKISSQSNWLNLLSDSWYDKRIDTASDHIHPGPLSHINYYDSLEDYIKKLGLSF